MLCLLNKADRLIVGSDALHRRIVRLTVLRDPLPHRIKALKTQFFIHSIHPLHYMTVLENGCGMCDNK